MKNKFKTIDNLNIIISFLKISNQNGIKVNILNELIKYLYNNMKNNNLVSKYRILFDYNIDSILTTAINNQNILTIDTIGNYINFTDNIDVDKKERIFKKYFISAEIDNIIDEFINKIAKTATKSGGYSDSTALALSAVNTNLNGMEEFLSK